MLIQITNSCMYMCPHCLQDSCPSSTTDMSYGVFKNAIELGKRMCASTVIISGGEPTVHPEWYNWVKEACHEYLNVILATNGYWLFQPEVARQVASLLTDHANLKVQITSVPHLYLNHDATMEELQKWRASLPKHIADTRTMCSTYLEAVVSLGRAARNPDMLERAKQCTSKTTSCLTSALLAAQLKSLKNVTRYLEMAGKFCHPLVAWTGSLHWSESWLCSKFFELPSHLLLDDAMYDQIQESALNWRPCGKCADYQKLLDQDDFRYVRAREILGITKKG